VRKFLAFLLIPLIVAACGGGGSSSNGGGGGGGGGGSGGPTPPPTHTISSAGGPNAEPLVIDAGPTGLPQPSANTAFVSVNVCVPGTSTCQLIDHIEVDTGSIGLRLIASVVTGVTLPALTDGTNPLGECLQFADGTSWGSLAVADVQMPVSGEKAANVNVQLITPSSGTVGTPPAACTGTAENTVATFGANGILGVGPFTDDCNDAGLCTPGASASYYSCPSSATCAPYNAPVAKQLPNPVTLFATDNNGVIIELPAVAAAGAATVTNGVLVFGIGTESNNALDGAVQLLADPSSGELSVTFTGLVGISTGFLDSGSNGTFFASSLAVCPQNGMAQTIGFYCPPATVSETSILTGTNGTQLAANFSVANAATLFNTNPTFTAFNDLAGTSASSSTLDLGLPYFFGRNIYVGIESAAMSSDPYFAVALN
jgi:Protein of unknown function (DUF3443)